MKKIICLDFDDCLINWQLFNNLKKNINQSILEFENTSIIDLFLKDINYNFNVIKEIAEKHNYKIFITSSWSSYITEKLTPKFDNKLNNEEKKILETIKNNISHLVIGIDKINNRIKTIKELSKNNNLIIVIDDYDMSKEFLKEDNIFYIKIINNIIYDINDYKKPLGNFEKKLENIILNIEDKFKLIK